MKKSTTIRIWLWIITALVLGMLLLTRCTLAKPELIAAITADCAKNMPFSAAWQADLRRFGIDADSAGLPEYYCQCTLGAPLEALSEKEIENLQKLSTQERLAKFGGAEGVQQRNDACLKDWAQKTQP